MPLKAKNLEHNRSLAASTTRDLRSKYMMLYRRVNKGFTMDEHKIQFVKRQWREFRYDGTDTFCEAWDSI